MLGPEMKSTGEVLGIAPNMHEALIKGLVAAGYQFKTPGPGSCVIISVKDSDKKEAAELAWKLHDYGYKTVSYTHLDVYKRQVQYLPGLRH